VTSPFRLREPRLRFEGSPELQRRFLEDLVATAIQDRYLFLVWFVPVDYDRIYSGSDPGYGILWMHAGLFDKDLKPKPVWDVWRGIPDRLVGTKAISAATRSRGDAGSINSTREP
jgi:hypothetical protein